MDKNTFTGLFLIMIIMAASFYFMRPSEADLKKERIAQHADSLKKGLLDKGVSTASKPIDSTKAAVNKQVDSAILKSPFGTSTVGTQKFVTLENKDISVKLATQGGRVYSVELKGYKTFDKKYCIYLITIWI